MGTFSPIFSGLKAAGPRRGFTLIEASLAIIIVGSGVLGIMRLLATCTQQNHAAADMTTAMLLASNVQETMAGLSFSDPAYARRYWGPEPGQGLATYDDVDDFDGRSFNPPIDASRAVIAPMGQYTQLVSVWPVYAAKLSSNSDETSPDLPKTTYTGAARVRVRILYQRTADIPAIEVYRCSWICVDR